MSNALFFARDIQFVQDPQESENNPSTISRRFPAYQFEWGTNRIPVDLVLARHIGMYETIVLEQLIKDYKKFSKIEKLTEDEKWQYSPQYIECAYLITKHELFCAVMHLCDLGLVASTVPVLCEYENFWLRLVPVEDAVNEMVKEAGYDY